LIAHEIIFYEKYIQEMIFFFLKKLTFTLKPLAMTSITGKVPGLIENPRPVHGEPPSIWNFITVKNQSNGKSL
jgi:hypothetical protein